jgi:adenine-specific DNA-methyltransferase
MARKKKNPSPAPAPPDLDAIRHKDSRKNIPTEELRDFVASDEGQPPKMLYPRDPSLDPQLVWKGKDDQDREPLEVDVVPIYIQEVIEPRAIIDAINSGKTTKPDNSGFLPGFFDDFDLLEFDHKVEFYQHDQHWANRMILGNSLQVMTSLAEKETLKGRVQMFYLDPPYGITFRSNWQVSTRNRDVKDGKRTDVTRQPEQVLAFRDTWKMGIHSYLSYLRDRFVVSRELLAETGSIFVQIGDDNQHLVRALMDEVFGAENFAKIITFSKASSSTDKYLPGTVDYILWYAKDIERMKFHQLFKLKKLGGGGGEGYTMTEEPDRSRRRLTADEAANPSAIPEGNRVFTLSSLTSPK